MNPLLLLFGAIGIGSGFLSSKSAAKSTSRDETTEDDDTSQDDTPPSGGRTTGTNDDDTSGGGRSSDTDDDTSGGGRSSETDDGGDEVVARDDEPAPKGTDDTPPPDEEEIDDIIGPDADDPIVDDPLDPFVGSGDGGRTTDDPEPGSQPAGGGDDLDEDALNDYLAKYNLPSIDPDDYDNVIFGKTFTSTLKINEGDDNTLIIGCKFVGIDGHGIELRDVSNVVIAENVFEDIEGTAVRFRSSGSTEDCAVINNEFDNIGLNGISSSKRSEDGVDHEGLIVHGNTIGDTGFNGNDKTHAIYVQSSDVQVSANTIVGEVDANAISIRGDGDVFDNYIDVSSRSPYGSGIKYYSDHMTGPTKTLVIEDNYVEGNGKLYSGIEIKMVPSAIPNGVADDDWVVNNFEISNNQVVDADKKLVIDDRLDNASWSDIKLSNAVDGQVDANQTQLANVVPLTTAEETLSIEPEEELDLGLIA